jgi:hypothetical protein
VSATPLSLVEITVTADRPLACTCTAGLGVDAADGAGLQVDQQQHGTAVGAVVAVADDGAPATVTHLARIGRPKMWPTSASLSPISQRTTEAGMRLGEVRSGW